ncbi:MAG: B12-binding domain-containing radical SAM protein [Proteobacteria bacterium]|nr:B12-binding domain-containing radical SAM protein [Pseudomonadota bacterium]MBU1686737.1 B12-binding domain-containing radical SAM protein [Pseudomonadota bacterium]
MTSSISQPTHDIARAGLIGRDSSQMKILLIDPPFGSIEMGGEKKRFAGVENAIPSLGLAYLAAVAEQDGHEVRIHDGTITPAWSAMATLGREFRPDVVGITAKTPSFTNCIQSAKILKEASPGVVLIAGGSHPTAMTEHALAAEIFDFLVLGEGEVTFRELLKKIADRGTDFESIPGLAMNRDGKPVITSPRPPIADLDQIPFPARHLLPQLTAYSPTAASYRRLPLAHVMTSRGCPSRCNFCDRAIFGERYRARSAANVLAEIDQLVNTHGAREIRFFDDTFTINNKRLTAICKGMKTDFPQIPWTCLTKAEAVTLDMLKMMHDAGCWQVLYGLESGDDTVLASLGKKNTVEMNRRAVRWARRAGLRVRADFLVGTPKETPETLQKTLDFAKELDIDFAHFNKFVPFPGTTFYQQLTSQGYTFDFSGSSSTLDHDALLYVPPEVPVDWYKKFLERSYKEFYLRPGYMVRRLLSMRTWPEFWGNFKGMFAINSL